MDKLKIPAGALVFLFFFSIYLFTMSGVIQYGDESEKYRVAQSIVERGELSFRPTVVRNIGGVGGKTFSIYELGQTVLEVPLYALGKSLNQLFPTPDENQIETLIVGLLNPLLSALACLVLFKSAGALGFQQRTALGLTGIYGLATIAWPYSRGYTREPLLTLTLLLALYGLFQFRRTRARRWLLVAGLAAGYLVFSKFIHAMVVPFLLAYLAFVIARTYPRAERASEIAKAFGVFLLPAFVFLVLQSFYAAARFGSPVVGLAGTKVNPVEWIVMLLGGSKPVEAIIGLLFLPDKNLFLYSPPVLLVLFALPQWIRKQKAEALLFLSIIVIEIIAVVSRPDWDGGTWWGPRYLVQITPLLILPIGILIESPAPKKWRAPAIFLFGVGLVVQILGAFSSDRDYVDITAKWTSIANQFDFLRFGALDSLMIYLAPETFPFRINLFGILLMLVAGVSGWCLVRASQRDAVVCASSRGIALAAIGFGVLLVGFIVWVVAPYPRVLIARGNTYYIAANNLSASNRYCEGSRMYLRALDIGTTYQREAITRYEELFPREKNGALAVDELMAQIELSDDALITKDLTTALTPEGALMISIAPTKDITATAISMPITAQAGAAYAVSGWIKTRGIYGSRYAAVTLYEDDGNWGHPRDTQIGAFDETHGWQPFRKAFTTLPTTQRMFIKTSLWKTYGTVWVDDVRLARASETKPIVCE
ncbi:hypothetical protein ANRL1_02935 [Anaerolineae bacterium]|nr:hypothetical protein ANRL1_02935 [Anaerolineae bacterium]